MEYNKRVSNSRIMEDLYLLRKELSRLYTQHARLIEMDREYPHEGELKNQIIREKRMTLRILNDRIVLYSYVLNLAVERGLEPNPEVIEKWQQ